MKRRITYLGFGLAAVSALVAVAFFLAGQTQTTSAAGGGPEMLLTANGCAADCTFANDEKFTLAVEAVQGPAAGYVGAQSYIDYGSDLIYDISTQSAADEFVWPGCTPLIALRLQASATSVLHGCLTGLLPPLPVSTFLGNFLELSVTCSAASSTTEVQLLPINHPVALTSGAGFIEAGTSASVIPKVSNLSVTCGGAPVDTPTPEGPTPTTGPTNTPGPTDTPAPATDTPVPPTATPVPDQICGDVDGDGEVSSLDALWVLWLDAGLVNSLLPSVEEGIADINRDGIVNSIDAALILQVVAGLYSCA